MTAPVGYLHWLRDSLRIRALSRGRLERELDAVVIFLFHGLFRSRQEAINGCCDPQQGITVEFFRQFVESLLTEGVTIRGLDEALLQSTPGLTAVITFDDGYFNNVLALRVLEEFAVPATFFISTSHVEEQKSFWWDALFREATRRGLSPKAIRNQVRSWKRLRNSEIERHIVARFGPRALTPVSECDRPFSPGELRAFTQSRLVSLGNHTRDHAILGNYEAEEIRDQIGQAQRFLAGISGSAPKSIAYPNGDYDARILNIARSEGLEVGVTVRAGLNVASKQQSMELRRLTVWGVPAAARQARVFGSVGRRTGTQGPDPKRAPQ